MYKNYTNRTSVHDMQSNDGLEPLLYAVRKNYITQLGNVGPQAVFRYGRCGTCGQGTFGCK